MVWPYWNSSMAQLDPKTDRPLCNNPLFCDQHTKPWHFRFVDCLATMAAKGTTKWLWTRRYLDFSAVHRSSPVAQHVHQWVVFVCMSTSVEFAASASRIPATPHARSGFEAPCNLFFNPNALGLVVDNSDKLVRYSTSKSTCFVGRKYAKQHTHRLTRSVRFTVDC